MAGGTAFPEYYVTGMGAIGDGVADDTYAINNALQTIPAGETLNFPFGTYKTRTGLTLIPGKVVKFAAGATITASAAGSGAINITAPGAYQILGRGVFTGGAGASGIVISSKATTGSLYVEPSTVAILNDGGISVTSQPAPTTGTRLGFISTGCRQPSSTSGSLTSWTSRSTHVAMVATSALKIAFPNWVSGENGPGASATLKASCEYPAGTFNQILFGGQVTGTIPNGGTIISDMVSLSVQIPEFATYWIRTTFNCSAGSQWCYGKNNQDAATYSSTAVTDLTMSGTISSYANGGQAVQRPIAIIGQTSKPSILGVGDSRLGGFGEDVAASGDCPDYTTTIGRERIWARYGGYCNIAAPGGTAGQFTSAHAQTVFLSQFASIAAIEYLINDINNGSNLAACQSYAQTISAYFSPLPVLWITLSPFTTSTDSWATAANQTVKSWEAIRTGFNDSIRAFGGISASGNMGLSGFIEVADLVETYRNSGKWLPVLSSSPVTTADGIHDNILAGTITGKATLPNL